VQEVAAKYLNQIVYIGWPHLIKAKVVEVFNKSNVVNLDGVRENEHGKAFNSSAEEVKQQLSINESHVDSIN